MRKVIKSLLFILLICLIIGLVFLIITDKKEKKPIKKEVKILTKEEKINKLINDMSIDEKIYQLLFVQDNNDDWSSYSNVKYGGVILGGKSVYTGLDSIGKNYKIKPLIATDDEGGIVERAAKGYKSARDYNADVDEIYNDELKKSKELLTKGINMNLGPVTDTVTKINTPLYRRSFSGKREEVKNCISTILKARQETIIDSQILGSVLKHYPGYPNIGVNSDYAEALDNTSADEINKNITVFDFGIEKGADGVMVSNVIYQNIDKDHPASLSSKIINSLREKFDGIIMTDDIGIAKGLINNDDRFIDALVAGNDMILIWDENVEDAFTNIKDNIGKSITNEDINKKIYRIINTKYDLGIIKD